MVGGVVGVMEVDAIVFGAMEVVQSVDGETSPAPVFFLTARDADLRIGKRNAADAVYSFTDFSQSSCFV